MLISIQFAKGYGKPKQKNKKTRGNERMPK